MTIILTILWMAIGYAIGSIPWGIVISKVFFKKDIRQYGSGNIGGTNVGRVCGPTAGMIVIVLDALKAFAVMCVCAKYAPSSVAWAGLAACIGHCFPIFVHFKGGKAVATSYGFLLGLGLFVVNDVVFAFVYPLLVFLTVLGLCRYVSVASMVSLVFAAILSMFVFSNKLYGIMLVVLAILVIIRHRSNIQRLLRKTESKVNWIK